MKILHVLLSLAPRRGGPVSVVTALACAQAKAGHQVTICTTNADYPAGVLCPPGTSLLCRGIVEVHYFSVQFSQLDISLHLAQYLRRHFGRFDVIHVHGLYRFPSTFAAWLARKYSVPYIICPHGALDPYLYARSSKSLVLKRLYERWLDLPNLNGASAIHYTAEDERELASFLNLRSPSFVVPNGIDWTPFETLPERGSFRKKMAIGDAPLVLFLGRLHHKKGLDILIPAFEIVKRAFPMARLAIVGPSNDGYGDQVRHWVREHALEDAVTFVDFLSGTDLIQAYVDADVFVLPSYTENFGMTVIEAMACGLPVVISNRVNIHAAITDAGAGIVTDCDVENVAQSVMTILMRPEESREMGAKGRSAAREHHAWPGIVESLTREYEKIIARVI